MKLRFDENDDLVVDDIPEDLMDLVAKRAEEQSIVAEELWRRIIVALFLRDLPIET